MDIVLHAELIEHVHLSSIHWTEDHVCALKRLVVAEQMLHAGLCGARVNGMDGDIHPRVAYAVGSHE